MRGRELAISLQSGQRSIADLMADLADGNAEVIARSTAALAQVFRGVITGEGPTVAGRVHFSRSLDAEDAALCATILVLAGRGGDPVSRAEADMLFKINSAADDRRDGRCFDDLLAKAVVHHVMAAGGRHVPSRDIALAASVNLDAWASGVEIDTEIRAWLQMQIDEMGSSSAAQAIAKAIPGVTPPGPQGGIAKVFDLAA
jgi:hypothetical protein